MHGSRLHCTALVLSVALAVGGCQQEKDPGVIAAEYVSAVFRGDAHTAYALVSSADQAARTVDEFRDRDLGPLVTLLANKVTLEVENVAKRGDRATVTVAVTAPDMSGLVVSFLGEAFSSLTSEDHADDAQQRLAQNLETQLKSTELPTTTTQTDFELVHEPSGWRMALDWATEDEVTDLLAEARELRAHESLYQARDRYNRVLELRSDNQEAQAGAESADREIQILEEKQAYLPKVELRNFRVGKGREFSFASPEPAIFGTVVNTGDRTLTKVEVTVYFLDSAGTVIAEEDYLPVFASRFSIGDAQPLRPNYVEDFGYRVGDSAPTAWAGEARAEITDLEFD